MAGFRVPCYQSQMLITAELDRSSWICAQPPNWDNQKTGHGAGFREASKFRNKFLIRSKVPDVCYHAHTCARSCICYCSPCPLGSKGDAWGCSRSLLDCRVTISFLEVSFPHRYEVEQLSRGRPAFQTQSFHVNICWRQEHSPRMRHTVAKAASGSRGDFSSPTRAASSDFTAQFQDCVYLACPVRVCLTKPLRRHWWEKSLFCVLSKLSAS